MAKRKLSLSASSADRWFTGRCPGSVQLARLCPRPKQNEYGKEGTNAHQLGEECIHNNVNPLDMVGEEVDEFVFGNATGEVFVVTQDMAEAVQVYVDYITERIEGLHSSNWHLEKSCSLELIGGQDGLIDALIMEPFDTIEIVDYKHGAGQLVDPFKNYQLLAYALGEYLEQHDQHYETCRITVVQPRAFDSHEAIKTWEFPFDELESKWIPAFEKAIRHAKREDELDIKQGKWCKYCPCKAYNCPKFKTDQLPTVAAAGRDISNMPLEKVAKVAANEDLIKEFIKACQARIEMEMLDFKNPVSGFKIVKKKRSKKYRDDNLAARELLETFDEDTLFSKKFKTPNQLIKLIGEEAIKPYLADHFTEYTIAQESDRRKAVDPDDI